MRKATRQQTKKHNSRLVLKTVYDQAEISRAAISRVTHLTRPTVSTLVGQLIEDGLIVEVGSNPAAVGKPPTLLAIDANAYHIITLDLGGQSFQAARVDLRGRLLSRLSIPAADHKGEAAVALTLQLIDQLLAENNGPLLGISIGTSGLIDPRTGVVRQALHLGWNELPLQARLATRYELPILVANDSHAAALGEYIFGQDTTNRNLVLVKTGRGISAGIVFNGSLFYGDGGGAGEIGQIVIDEITGEQPVSLEMHIGTLALLARARSIAGETLTWETFAAAVAAGDPALGPIASHAAVHLGRAIAHLIAILNIQHVVIAGRFTQFGEPFRQEIINAALRYALVTQVKETTIHFSKLGSDAVLLGCAAMMIKQELGIL